MNKPMFSIGRHDVVKGLITAIGASVFTTLAGVFSQAGFDVFSADWGAIINDIIKVACATFVGYIGKNFFSDEEGKFVGTV